MEHHMVKARHGAYTALFNYAEEMKKDGFYKPEDICKEIDRIAQTTRAQFAQSNTDPYLKVQGVEIIEGN